MEERGLRETRGQFHYHLQLYQGLQEHNGKLCLSLRPDVYFLFGLLPLKGLSLEADVSVVLNSGQKPTGRSSEGRKGVVPVPRWEGGSHLLKG